MYRNEKIRQLEQEMMENIQRVAQAERVRELAEVRKAAYEGTLEALREAGLATSRLDGDAIRGQYDTEVIPPEP